MFTFPVGGGVVRQLNVEMFGAGGVPGSGTFRLDAAHPKGEYNAVAIANFSPKNMGNVFQIISGGFHKVTIQ